MPPPPLPRAVPPLPRPPASGRDPALAKLFDTFFWEGLAQNPEGATQLGLDKGAHADLRAKSSDQSTAGRDAARALNASQLKRIEAFDPAELSTADRIDYDVVLYQRRASADVAKFDFGGSGYGPSPYVISQQSGAYQSTPDFLDTKQPVETAADADAYLARLDAFAGNLAGNTDRFQADVARGIIPPDFILDLTLAQMKALRTTSADARTVQSLATRAKAKGLGDAPGTKAAGDLGQPRPARARRADRRGHRRPRQGHPRRRHLAHPARRRILPGRAATTRPRPS